jgi:putative ABC transport system permease protein
MFAGESAVGKRFYMDGTPESPGLVTIVGVVEHVRTYQLATPQYVQVYVPLEQPPNWMLDGFPPANLVIRSSSAPEPMFSAIRGVVERLDPAQPIYGTTTLDEVRQVALNPERTNTVLSSSFALAALGLAALGLYGVLANIVSEKTPEIGLRMALGATPYFVWRSIVHRALALVAVGSAVGLLGGFGVSRLAASLLHGVAALDAQVTIATVGLLGVVAVLGCFVPARRAMRIQAVDALRHE